MEPEIPLEWSSWSSQASVFIVTLKLLLSDYEEDFEVDDEKQDEKVDEDEDQADDQMSGGSKTPTESEKDNRNPEKKIETSSEKAHDSENEDTGCSDSEEDDRQGRWQSVVHCEGSSPFLLRKTDVWLPNPRVPASHPSVHFWIAELFLRQRVFLSLGNFSKMSD